MVLTSKGSNERVGSSVIKNKTWETNTSIAQYSFPTILRSELRLVVRPWHGRKSGEEHLETKEARYIVDWRTWQLWVSQEGLAVGITVSLGKIFPTWGVASPKRSFTVCMRPSGLWPFIIGHVVSRLPGLFHGHLCSQSRDLRKCTPEELKVPIETLRPCLHLDRKLNWVDSALSGKLTAEIVSLAAISSWWWLYTNDWRSPSNCRISGGNNDTLVNKWREVLLPDKSSFSLFKRAGNEDVVINCS